MQSVLKQKNTSLRGISSLIMFSVAAICILGNPSDSSQGALNGLKICSSVIIPALFPFTVVSIFLQKSGGISLVANKTQRFTKAIFGMDGEIFSVMLISLIGGYPVAAKIINDMVRDGTISESTAKKALRFSVNASPAFFISVIGAEILKSKAAGLLIFIANMLACLILSTITFRIKDGMTERKTTVKPKHTLSDAFVISVSEGCDLLLKVCAWIIFFSSITGILKSIIKNAAIYSFLCPFLEITVGCIEISKIGIKPQFFSLLLAFGGLSTICQIKQVIPDIDFSFTDLIIFRVIHGGVATAISFALFKTFPPAIDVISNSVDVIFNGFPLELSSIVLGLTAIVFLVYIKPQNKPELD